MSTKFSGFAGTEDGMAKDPIARIFGCPDRIGMAAIAGTAKFKFCYHIKRPAGQFLLFGSIAGLLLLLWSKEAKKKP